MTIFSQKSPPYIIFHNDEIWEWKWSSIDRSMTFEWWSFPFLGMNRFLFKAFRYYGCTKSKSVSEREREKREMDCDDILFFSCPQLPAQGPLMPFCVSFCVFCCHKVASSGTTNVRLCVFLYVLSVSSCHYLPISPPIQLGSLWNFKLKLLWYPLGNPGWILGDPVLPQGDPG